MGLTVHQFDDIYDNEITKKDITDMKFSVYPDDIEKEKYRR
jgi:hypothetical protein